MLVLGRKVGETIVLGLPGGEVLLTVVSISSGKVRLGVHAPDTVPVNRGEVWERILAEGRKVENQHVSKVAGAKLPA